MIGLTLVILLALATAYCWRKDENKRSYLDVETDDYGYYYGTEIKQVPFLFHFIFFLGIYMMFLLIFLMISKPLFGKVDTQIVYEAEISDVQEINGDYTFLRHYDWGNKKEKISKIENVYVDYGDEESLYIIREARYFDGIWKLIFGEWRIYEDKGYKLVLLED